MKTLRISFLMLLFFGFFACSDDDDSASADMGASHIANLQATGSSAHDFLSADKFTTLRIELLYVAGFQPDAQSISNLQAFLESRLNKPGGITITERQVASPAKAPYEINEVTQFESASRTMYNTGNTLSLYIFFADGGVTDDTSTSFTLGTAYRNTSLVIYEKSVQMLSDSITETSRIALESTVLEHEIGHLLGLVNLGSPMQNEHLDEAHDKHCDNDNCLMYWEAESNRITSMMNGGIPQFDANCLADLRANGGK